MTRVIKNLLQSPAALIWCGFFRVSGGLKWRYKVSVGSTRKVAPKSLRRVVLSNALPRGHASDVVAVGDELQKAASLQVEQCS